MRTLNGNRIPMVTMFDWVCSCGGVSFIVLNPWAGVNVEIVIFSSTKAFSGEYVESCT